jgi:hypothetical protein
LFNYLQIMPLSKGINKFSILELEIWNNLFFNLIPPLIVGLRTEIFDVILSPSEPSVRAAAWSGGEGWDCAGRRRRQVALLFLNRHAKQLEKQYDTLMRELDAIMADNNGLISHKRCRWRYLSLSSRLSSISPLLLSTSIDSS